MPGAVLGTAGITNHGRQAPDLAQQTFQPNANCIMKTKYPI